MERKHAILVITNKEGKYLQYYDEIWQSYLFLNCKINDEQDFDWIIKEIKQKYHLDIISLNLVMDKIHSKFSEKDKIIKEYHHYFYLTSIKESSLDNNFKYMSYEELLKDERIQKVNSDIVQFIKELPLKDLNK